MRGWPVAFVLVGLSALTPARGARACSPEPAPPPTALPRSGAADVSTATSIIVVMPVEPFGVTVSANGQPVPVPRWYGLGSGVDGLGGRTSFWRLELGILAANTTYVVTVPYGAQDGGATTLTSFATAPGYDKTAGTPANLRALHLWRVRYPVADIASGNCVFAEYHSFITVDYDAATLPNTPAGSVIQTFQLTPETGGTTQTFVYTGEAPFPGLAPTGDYPTPLGRWQPELDPTRRYCLAISSTGYGNLANLGAGSNRLCADVVQLSARGAPPPVAIGGGAGADGSAGAGGGGSAGTDAGTATDGGAPLPHNTGGGCSISNGTAGALGLAILFAALGLALVRRSGAHRR